jgi:predicted chitinase
MADAENGRRKDEGGRHGREERKAKCKSQISKVKTADVENGRRKVEGGRHGREERKAKCKSQISKVKTGDGRS